MSIILEIQLDGFYLLANLCFLYFIIVIFYYSWQLFLDLDM
jgi:hypothetical protein